MITKKLKTDCPDCGGDIPFTTKDLKCPKCGSQFQNKIQIHLQPKEFMSPILYAKAHLLAANRLLDSAQERR